MTKYNPYRITTDGIKYRIEQIHHLSTNPDIEPVWAPISVEMDYLAQAKIALDRLNNPTEWKPISN